MNTVPNNPKVIIKAPFPRKDGQDLKEYVLSLIKHFEEQSDVKSCAELYHFLVQIFFSQSWDLTDEKFDLVAIDIQFENKTVVDEEDERKAYFMEKSEVYDHLHKCVRLFLEQLSLERMYEVLYFYCWRVDSILSLKTLKYLQGIIAMIQENTSNDFSRLGYHYEKLAGLWEKFCYPAQLFEELQGINNPQEESGCVVQILSSAHAFYHQAIQFYQSHGNYADGVRVYLELAKFTFSLSHLTNKEWENKVWYVQANSIVGKKKSAEYFETAIDLCLQRSCYSELEKAFEIWEQGAVADEGRWFKKVAEHLFTLKEVDQKFADKLLSCFLKIFQFSRYEPADYMHKLLFVFEKFANAKLNWAVIKNHKNLMILIKQFAQLYMKNPPVAYLINSITALFTWGENKKILVPDIRRLISVGKVLYLKFQESELIDIVSLSSYKSAEDNSTVPCPNRESVESYQAYCLVGKNLVRHNAFILENLYGSISKVEINLFAFLTQLVVNICNQLPNFVEKNPFNTEKYYPIFDSKMRVMLIDQAKELNQLVNSVSSLKINALSKIDLAVEQGRAQQQLSEARNRIANLEEQLSEFSGERNLAKPGAFGEDDGKTKKRKQSTLEGFFAQKRLKVTEDSEKQTQEESSSSFIPTT